MPKQLGTTYEASRASAPTGVAEGQTYYDTVKKIPFFYDGTTWKPAIGVLQTVQNEITVNQTTTSGAFTNLITQSITTGANFLIVTFDVTTSNNSGTAQNFFRIRVDGVTERAGGCRMAAANTAQGVSLSARVPVTAGTHSVTVDWYRSAGTAQIRPVAAPDSEGGSLIIWEVTA